MGAIVGEKRVSVESVVEDVKEVDVDTDRIPDID